jgi:hypothetical protein
MNFRFQKVFGLVFVPLMLLAVGCGGKSVEVSPMDSNGETQTPVIPPQPVAEEDIGESHPDDIFGGEEITASPAYPRPNDVPKNWTDNRIAEVFSVKEKRRNPDDQSLERENDLRYWLSPWISGEDARFFETTARTPENELTTDWARYWCGFSNGVLGKYGRMEQIFKPLLSSDSIYRRRALFFSLLAADEQLDKQKFETLLSDAENRDLLLQYTDELRRQARALINGFAELEQVESAPDIFASYGHCLKAKRTLPDSFLVRAAVLDFFIDASSPFNRPKKLALYNKYDGFCYECSITENDAGQLRHVIKYLLYLAYLSNESYFNFDTELFEAWKKPLASFAKRRVEGPDDILGGFEAVFWKVLPLKQFQDYISSDDESERIIALLMLEKEYDRRQFAPNSDVWDNLRIGSGPPDFDAVSGKSYEQLLRAYDALKSDNQRTLSSGFRNLINARRGQYPHWGELTALTAEFYEKMGYPERASQLMQNIAQLDITPVATYLAAEEIITDFQQKLTSEGDFDISALEKAEKLLSVSFPDELFSAEGVNFDQRLADNSLTEIRLDAIVQRRKEQRAYVLANLGRVEEAAAVISEIDAENRSIKAAILLSNARFEKLRGITRLSLLKAAVRQPLREYEDYLSGVTTDLGADARSFVQNNTKLLEKVYPRFLFEYRFLKGLSMKVEDEPRADTFLTDKTLFQTHSFDTAELQVLALWGLIKTAPLEGSPEFHFAIAKRLHSEKKFAEALREIETALPKAGQELHEILQFWEIKIGFDASLTNADGNPQKLINARPKDLDEIVNTLSDLKQRSRYRNEVSLIFYLGIAEIMDRDFDDAFNRLSDALARLESSGTFHLIANPVDESDRARISEARTFYKTQAERLFSELERM